MAREPEWQAYYLRYEELRISIEDFAMNLRGSGGAEASQPARSYSLSDLTGSPGGGERFGQGNKKSSNAEPPSEGGNTALVRSLTFRRMLGEDASPGQERRKRSNGSGDAMDVAQRRRQQAKDFSDDLDHSLTVLVCFFLEEQGRLAQHIRQLLTTRRNHEQQLRSVRSISEQGTTDPEADLGAALGTLVREFCEAGRHVVRLIEFLELNVTGVRKILKKFDKVLRSNLAPRYLQSRAGPWGVLTGTRAQSLYSLAGVIALQLRDLTSTDATVLGDLNGAADRQRPSANDLRRLTVRSSVAQGEPANVLLALRAARTQMEEAQTRLITDYAVVTSRIGLEQSVARESPTLPVEVRLTSPGPQTAKAANEMNIFHDWSHMLNLTSTFLYMSNYYIVAPTSGAYAARLGGGSSLSATIIGCTPLMASFGTIMYSRWSNYHFRTPLIFCSCLMTLGNLLYATALPCESLWMILAGRMINGLGGPRCINRRFVADCTTATQRQDASAAFVAAGALGMAFGPVMCAVLKILPDFTIYGSWTVNELTAPGWAMALLWIAFLVLFLVFFKEPERVCFAPGAAKQPSSTAKAARVSGKKAATAGGASRPLLTQGDQGNYGAAGGVPDKTSGGPSPAPETRLLQQDSTEVPFDAEERADDCEGGHAGAMRRLLGCCCRMDAGVAISLGLYFVNKVIVEVLISSAPSISQHRFKFSTSECSAMMAVFGILVLPTNAILSYVASRRAAFAQQQLEQRSLGAHDAFHHTDGETDLTLYLGFGGALALLLLLDIQDVGMELRTARYIFATMLGFVVMQAQEGVVLSKLSKIIAFRDPESAKGTCNSGLLATEAGTLGRTVGDLFITVVASIVHGSSGQGWHVHTSREAPRPVPMRFGLVNGIFGPSLFLLLGSLYLLHRNRAAVAV